MNDETILAVLQELHAENQALLLLVGLLMGESSQAIQALLRLAPLSDEATLNTSLTDDQRESVKAVLARVLERAQIYRKTAYNEEIRPSSDAEG